MIETRKISIESFKGTVIPVATVHAANQRVRESMKVVVRTYKKKARQSIETASKITLNA